MEENSGQIDTATAKLKREGIHPAALLAAYGLSLLGEGGGSK